MGRASFCLYLINTKRATDSTCFQSLPHKLTRTDTSKQHFWQLLRSICQIRIQREACVLITGGMSRQVGFVRPLRPMACPSNKWKSASLGRRLLHGALPLIIRLCRALAPQVGAIEEILHIFKIIDWLSPTYVCFTDERATPREGQNKQGTCFAVTLSTQCIGRPRQRQVANSLLWESNS